VPSLIDECPKIESRQRENLLSCSLAFKRLVQQIIHIHPSLDGAWIFEMYMKCKYKCTNCKSITFSLQVFA
jgi:hypothetical protein